MSGCQPRAALAARRARRQHLYALRSDCRGSGTVRRTDLQLHIPPNFTPHCLRVGGGERAARGTGRCFTARKTSITQAPLRPNKSAAARKYDFTKRGMRELRHAARLLHTFPLCSVQKEGMMGSAVSAAGMIQWGLQQTCRAEASDEPLQGSQNLQGRKEKQWVDTEGEWNYLKQLSHFLARTSKKKKKKHGFSLGSAFDDLWS